MSKIPLKSTSRILTKILFCISTVALIFFNAYAMIGRQAMSQSIEQIQSEIDTRLKQLKMVKPIHDRYHKESRSDIEEFASLVHQIRKQRRDDEELAPILDHEFAITKIDKSGERTICLSVPANGKHRLKVQATLRSKQLMDRNFDLVSGGSYRIKFMLADNNLTLRFPNEEPTIIAMENFSFANRITNMRCSLSGSPTFVSCNQPRWRMKSSLKTEEHGVLTQFAFMSNSIEPEEHLVIKITAESDGPPTAAADDPATVLHIDSLLRNGFEPEYQFKDGRYTFER